MSKHVLLYTSAGATIGLLIIPFIIFLATLEPPQLLARDIDSAFTRIGMFILAAIGACLGASIGKVTE